MTQCNLSIEDGLIVATLVGADCAPNRSWDRERLESGTVYRKTLNRSIAASAIRDQCIQDLDDGIDFHLSEELTSLDCSNESLLPIAHASWIDGKMQVQTALRSSRGDVICPPAASLVNIEIGYSVHENKILFFDVPAMQFLRQTVDEVAEFQNDKLLFSYRDFLRLARALDERGLEVIHGYQREDVMSFLCEAFDNQELQIPDHFKGTLYDYQKRSVEWLQFCHSKELGALLALDMGLGKTCVTIALIAHARDEGASLVVCPLSLMQNWKDEFEKFCPSLDVRISHGPQRIFFADQFNSYDVVICSYGTLKSNLDVMSSIKWNVLALDEAQRIKNPDSETSISCRGLTATCPVALTGTPFENRPLDLWALMDFLEPNFLGSKDEFERQYGQPISRGDSDAIEDLKESIAIFMMRQKKEEVLEELPSLTEKHLPIIMTSRESTLYNAIYKRLEIQSGGAWDFGDQLTLRRFCSHPKVFYENNTDLSVEIGMCGDDIYASTKYELLLEMLEKIKANGEKAIIFAESLATLSHFEEDLPNRAGFKVFRIDGSVDPNERKAIVDQFQTHSDPSVLVGNYLTLGTGLNITGANHVFHYNLPWNPAVMDQATDRTHRIGQTKGVFAYYLYYAETIDEDMMNRILSKRDLEGQIITSSDDKSEDQEDLMQACYLRPTIYDD